ncbi:MAG: PorT family protein [Saprospiraceae bacterium]|nr:PorT family protein [Saprospiraceae bacterium]
MKKIIYLLLAWLLCPCLLEAQTFAPTITYGVKAGLNFSGQSRADAEGYNDYIVSGRTGFHLGVMVDVLPVWETPVHFQAQLLYQGKGGTHKRKSDGANETTIAMDYVELPILGVYKHKQPFGKLYGGLGPVLGYALGGKLEQNGETKKMFSDEIQNWKRSDFGLMLIAGVELPNGFTAGLNFNLGLKDIYDHEAANIKNRNFSLTVGYHLQR